MGLTRSSQRAYLEARRRQVSGEPSQDWVDRPGSSHDLEVWMAAFELADYEDVSPWDALLLAVRRRAARVRVVDKFLDAALAQHAAAAAEDPTLDPNVPGDEVRKWLTESRNEERLLARTAKMAVDAGVAKMLIERQQLEGQMIADVLVAALDVLNLTPEQRMLALGEVQRQLVQAAGQDAPDRPDTIPGVDEDGDDTE